MEQASAGLLFEKRAKADFGFDPKADGCWLLREKDG
jgi:hypothetical protein